ncbi:MAG TPA: methyltransferase [Thermodesulfatator atlanticus]|uniref:Methyltransferase n=1 Tax=Thermodesulfatator atlanticus TaxID=501497 RepID=A0A7V5NZ71_9BACT|nr:methyltransferase [Thermodesulfatator atlanticus]
MNWTEERVLNGRLRVRQPREGYRYALDAFLLASFVTLRKEEKAVELGAGVGIVTLILAAVHPHNLFWGLEIQPGLVSLLAQNIRLNALEHRVLALWADIRRLPLKPGLFEVVYANPPYYQKGRGRLSPCKEERLAKHEILATLEDFITAAHFLLKNRGRFYLICKAERLAEALVGLEEKRLAPKRLRLVHSYPGDQARLFLLEAVKEGGKELRVEAPLFVYQAPGGPYTQEVQAIFDGSFFGPK